jgi:hypothetical protein
MSNVVKNKIDPINNLIVFMLFFFTNIIKKIK